ncbi:Formamidopyrimidine-DNA glycosylase [Sandaracinus amylolyticus]|uniref:Formamidopyrimidine-DNA glycosylase n=2 Tax=Sandaracinus amylolyticus TaxID=927083 RepID=A0A0F6YND5_9BACT|nr:Formamidopyrimidine-DNA glycosylase [Sandaracinus amylolyticus]
MPVSIGLPMPELPDITLYIEALEARVIGRTLASIRLASPFVLRSVDPKIADVVGHEVIGLRRMGKRIVFAIEPDVFAVVHLMIAGRFQWKDEAKAKIPGKVGLLAFDFVSEDGAEHGTLLLTEASTKKRASLHLVRGEAALRDFDRGGLEPLGSTLEQFKDALTRERHTLKRALTDPRLFSGIGNAYSDEILHRAKMSPVTRSDRLDDAAIATLHRATIEVLEEWIDRMRAELAGGFPAKVTAFRPEMAVHGKYGQPCPVCGTKVQRIVYAENESNYCPRCQTEGKLLADRSLSRLLKGNWPKTIEELEGR